MNIGNKIKKLRKKKGITQEELARDIGISFQAISKWENGVSLPDITLTPILASYFGVSMDELFDFNLQRIESEIEKITNEAHKFRESDPEKSRGILEAGLEQYPGNDILLNNLLYVLNYNNNPDETIKIAGKLMENTTHTDVKYDAMRFLAYAYKVKGDLTSAEAAIEQIPEIYFTKLSEAAYLFEGKKKFEAAEKQKWISFENLIQMMWKIAECYESDGEIQKAINEAQKALRLIAIAGNSDFDCYTDFLNRQVSRLNAIL